MASTDGQRILEHLAVVAAERRQRAQDTALAARVQAVKLWQHQRFAATYADLLATPRYAKAARFFLDDLYGPHDFSERDDQFVRIVPALVRLFPEEIVQTVQALAELHAVSEELDTQMGLACNNTELDAQTYGEAWRAVARPGDRERQIRLMLDVGAALDRFTRNPLLRHSLKLMRGPARAAGLGALQAFLENGFDTFREMRGAREFLDTVAARERALAAALFAAQPVPNATSGTPGSGQVP
ncbi:MAG: hypothetical protein WAQ05_17470 [Rubrivivax sp.]